MSGRQETRERDAHSAEVRQVYERVLAGASVRGRYVELGSGNHAHLLEKGDGPPVVLLHGTGNTAGFFRPLLDELDGVHVLAADLPGLGLSDPIDVSRSDFREAAVAWLDDLLDALGLDSVTLLGHSGGGVRALWYALARPDRVERLVLLGVPTLPKTRCPLPLRLASTPGLGDLLSRLVPPSRKSALRLGRFMGEGETLPRHPDLVDLMVAVGRDPIADHAARTEFRTLISPFALLTPSGWRRGSRVRPDELRRVAMPTLVVWGERDPIGGPSVAQEATGLIPKARLEMLPTGHGVWLGEPARTARAVEDFVRHG